MVLYNFGTARAYGYSSTSSSRLERDMRRRGAVSLYWNSNAFALGIEAPWSSQRWIVLKPKLSDF